MLEILGLGLRMEGIISSPAVYTTAARVAVSMVFRGHVGLHPRLATTLSKQIFGRTDEPSRRQVLEAAALLDRWCFLPSPPAHCVRVTANFGECHDAAGRAWAMTTCFREGLRPRLLVARFSMIPHWVPCVVGQVGNWNLPYVVADVPRDYVPGLAAAQVGDRGVLPRIPLAFLVAVNGLPLESFAWAWQEHQHAWRTSAAIHPRNGQAAVPRGIRSGLRVD